MFKSGFIVMFINVISRILGLVREMILAYFYGGSGVTDAYFASAKISNFFTTFFGEGALGTVFIPLYNEKKQKEGLQAANEFVYSIINLVFNFTFTVSIILIVFSKYILLYLIGFNDAQRLDLANNLLKIMAFYLMFISLSGMLASFLNSYKKFIVSTSTALVFNLTIIIGTIITKNSIGIYGLAISFLISGFLQFLIQVPSFIKIIKSFKFRINLKDEYVTSFFKLTIPTLIGIFAYQINEFIDTNFASYLQIGTISAINYASRLYLLPVGVFAVSLSVVIFPSLSIAVVKENYKLEREIFTKGINLLTFLVIPSSIGLFFYSKDIVSLIFGYGKFNANNVLITSEILKCYAVGLLFFCLNHLLTREHYVHKNRNTPVIASFVAIFVNVALDYLLYKEYRHIGLTLATSFSAMINFTILFVSIKIKYIDFNFKKYFIYLILFISSALLSLYISNIFNNLFIKLFIFASVYLIIWAYYVYKNKFNFFE